jgi:hypothetical protein
MLQWVMMVRACSMGHCLCADVIADSMASANALVKLLDSLARTVEDIVPQVETHYGPDRVQAVAMQLHDACEPLALRLLEGWRLHANVARHVCVMHFTCAVISCCGAG